MVFSHKILLERSRVLIYVNLKVNEILVPSYSVRLTRVTSPFRLECLPLVVGVSALSAGVASKRHKNRGTESGGNQIPLTNYRWK